MRENIILISPSSLKFFSEWYEINEKLKKATYSFKISVKALEELGISLFDILNLYTGRLVAFIIYEAYIDSEKEPDYQLIIACELLDIILFHLLDDIIDRNNNLYVSYYGESKILALSIPIIFEIVNKYPFFSKIIRFYEYDYYKPSSLKEYLRKLVFSSFYPLEIIFDYIKPNKQIRKFWKITSQYLKILDDIKDNDTFLDKSTLIELAKNFEREMIIQSTTPLQKNFVNYLIINKNSDILEETDIKISLLK